MEERRQLRRDGGAPGFDRKAMAQGVKAAQDESFKNRDSYGKWIGIFKDQNPALPFWTCNAGGHVIDIIPFRVGQNNPNGKKEGDYTYVLDIWVHRGIGVEEGTYVCMAKSFGEPCPICEYIREARRGEFDEKFIKRISAARRSIYNIVETTSDQTAAKGVQIWDVAHFYMEAELTVLAQDPRSAGGAIPYADPDVGKSIAFTKDAPQGAPPKYKGLKFMDRVAPISDAILMQAKPLDDLLLLPNYTELQGVLEKGISTPKSDARDEGPSNVREATSEGSPAGQVADAPAAVTQGNCPHGHKFGADCELFPECTKCTEYTKCADAYDQLTKK